MPRLSNFRPRIVSSKNVVRPKPYRANLFFGTTFDLDKAEVRMRNRETTPLLTLKALTLYRVAALCARQLRCKQQL